MTAASRTRWWSRPPARRWGATAASSRTCGPTTWPRSRSTRPASRRGAPGKTSATSSSAAPTRPARTTATSARMALLLAGFPVEVPGQTVNRLCGSGHAGDDCRGARDPGGGGGHHGRRGRGEHDARALGHAQAGRRLPARSADGVRHGARLAVRQPEDGGVTARCRWGRPRSAWREVRGLARGPGRFRPAQPPARRRGAAGRPARGGDRSGRVAAAQGRTCASWSRTRGAAGRHLARGACQAAAGLRENGLGDRGQLLSAQRRRDGAGLDVGSRSPGARAHTAGAACRRAAPPACTPTTWASGRSRRSRKALEQAGLRLADIGVVELNEAFASQSLAVLRAARVPDEESVNVNGGAIALGHPLGTSGARLVATLVREMAHRDASTDWRRCASASAREWLPSGNASKKASDAFARSRRETYSF